MSMYVIYAGGIGIIIQLCRFMWSILKDEFRARHYRFEKLRETERLRKKYEAEQAAHQRKLDEMAAEHARRLEVANKNDYRGIRA